MIVLLGDGLVAVSPIHKATPTATVAPSTSIAGIREATTASTVVSPATSATVTPSSEVQRLVQLWLQQVRPAFVTPCSSNAFFDAVVSFLDKNSLSLGGTNTAPRAEEDQSSKKGGWLRSPN